MNSEIYKRTTRFLKHCGEHFEILTGGRGHSKTKEVIEDLQQELERYKNIIDEIFDYCKEQQEKSFDVVAEECYTEIMYLIEKKKEELKGE